MKKHFRQWRFRPTNLCYKENKSTWGCLLSTLNFNNNKQEINSTNIILDLITLETNRRTLETSSHTVFNLHNYFEGKSFITLNERFTTKYPHVPIFFSNTVNSQVYVIELFQPFIAQLTEEEREYAFFQQDGATVHISWFSVSCPWSFWRRTYSFHSFMIS